MVYGEIMSIPFKRINNAPPTKLIDWLLYRQSFIERLKQYGAKSPHVQILLQRWQKPTSIEAKKLDILPHRYAFIRQTFIKSDKTIWMFARVVFPPQSLVGKNQQLLHLKNRSQGSILFKDPYLQRSEFEIYQSLPKPIQHLIDEPLWSRTSIFYFHQKPETLKAEVPVF